MSVEREGQEFLTQEEVDGYTETLQEVVVRRGESLLREVGYTDEELEESLQNMKEKFSEWLKIQQRGGRIHE